MGASVIADELNRRLIVQLPYAVEQSTQEALSLVSLLRETTLFLWKDWPGDMLANLINPQAHTFTLAGVCPHCFRDSAFLLSTSVLSTHSQWIAGMQCQGCMKYILGIVRFQSNSGNLHYVEHYPLGKPDDSADEEIPDHIRSDFKEALRCLWVNAYNATAEMCRRAVEASCIELGAPTKKTSLEDMIDWLEAQRVITPFLQKVAHKIRLGGNRGAHPEEDAQPAVGQEEEKGETINGPITKIEEEHAKAIVKFTREFLHHVYVVPKQLDRYDFSKPKAVKP